MCRRTMRLQRTTEKGFSTRERVGLDSEARFSVRGRAWYQRKDLLSEKLLSIRERAQHQGKCCFSTREGAWPQREKVFNVIKKGSVSVRDQRKDCLDVRKGLVSQKGFSFSLVSEKGFSISPIALRKDAQATGWRWKKRGRLGELLAAEGSRAESRTD